MAILNPSGFLLFILKQTPLTICQNTYAVNPLFRTKLRKTRKYASHAEFGFVTLTKKKGATVIKTEVFSFPLPYFKRQRKLTAPDSFIPSREIRRLRKSKYPRKEAFPGISRSDKHRSGAFPRLHPRKTCMFSRIYPDSSVRLSASPGKNMGILFKIFSVIFQIGDTGRRISPRNPHFLSMVPFPIQPKKKQNDCNFRILTDKRHGSRKGSSGKFTPIPGSSFCRNLPTRFP